MTHLDEGSWPAAAPTCSSLSSHKPSAGADVQLRELTTYLGSYTLPHFDFWRDRHVTAPVARVLHPGARVVVLGDCFAENAAEYLNRRGYRASVHPSGELYTPQALGLELEHVLAGVAWPLDPAVEVPGGWLHRFRRRGAARTRRELYDNDQRDTAIFRKNLLESDVVILLIGATTEIWHDDAMVAANEIPHPAVFSRGKWRVDLGTLEAARQCVRTMRRALDSHVSAHQVYAVGPIPLKATWSSASVVAANGRVKALLRTALDIELDEDSIYLDLWDWGLAQTERWSPTRTDGRHLTPRGVRRIMEFAEIRLGGPGRSRTDRLSDALSDLGRTTRSIRRRGWIDPTGRAALADLYEP